MNRNPGDAKTFLLQYGEENVRQVKIAWHERDDIFQRGSMHQAIGDITVSDPDARCCKREQGNDARYADSFPAVVSGFTETVNNPVVSGSFEKGIKVRRIALGIRIDLKDPVGRFR